MIPENRSMLFSPKKGRAAIGDNNDDPAHSGNYYRHSALTGAA
jgi:hypothetical protein